MILFPRASPSLARRFTLVDDGIDDVMKLPEVRKSVAFVAYRGPSGLVFGGTGKGGQIETLPVPDSADIGCPKSDQVPGRMRGTARVTAPRDYLYSVSGGPAVPLRAPRTPSREGR